MLGMLGDVGLLGGKIESRGMWGRVGGWEGGRLVVGKLLGDVVDLAPAVA